ncbi:MAG: protein kinase [Deltaproteobacteria bacterium]|nr:protein kinase [Deltaproteobacteria bacterium]
MGPDSDIPHRRSIGPFLLEDVLGCGGMGVVYRGRAPDGRNVAVKVLRLAQAPASVVRRFQREARIRIDHPNVVEVVDTGTDADGTPYLALELLEGSDLDTLIHEGGGLSPAQIVEVGQQVCTGLGTLHRLGIVHRDLKPHNLFRCTDGTIKILDFGIALLETKETRLTAGGIVGTPSYLAPEQARGRPDIDPRADLWALGAVLYEAVSGRPPFERETQLATVVAVVMDEIVPLWLAAPDAPRALADVIHRALRKDRDERWQTAAEMAAALRDADLGPGCDTALDTLGAAGPDGSIARGPGRSLITTAEQRVVAVLLAEGVSDMAGLESAVLERGGTLQSLLDERAIAAFGGHSWEGDEGVRATAAALCARAAARAMAVVSGWATMSGAGLSGAVLQKAERGCAACLEGVAVDPETARGLEGAFRIQPAADGLLEVCVEISPNWPSAGTGDSLERPTLGRDPDLAQIQAALRATLDEERAVTMLVVGPAGMGKTRLRRETERLLGDFPERIWLTGQSLPTSRDVSLSLFRSALEGRSRMGTLLRGWPRIGGGAPAEERRAAVRTIAREAFSDPGVAAELASFLGELLGVVMEESPTLLAAEADGRLMADRIRLALLDYFEGLAQKGPIALLVEDLQWADDASLEMLATLVDRMESTPLFIFATARPELEESRPGALGWSNLRRLVLHGLPGGDVARIAREVSGRDLAAPLTRRIAELTGGNPFFVEQMALALRDRGLDATGPDDLPLPVTVEATIQSRLDHLSPEEKDLTKRASVLGRPFSVEEAESLGVPEAREVLASLCQKEIMATRVRTRMGQRDYQFRSPLTAEVAYRMLPDELRGELHRRVGRYLDAAAESSPEEVASHFERGDLCPEAARRYAAAALAAARRGDGATVLRCSDRALALGAPSGQAFALRMARVDTLKFMDRRDALEGEIEASLESASTEAERARVLIERVNLLLRAGRSAEALEVSDHAVAVARSCGEPDVLALVLARRAATMAHFGSTSDIREVLSEATTLAEGATPLVAALAAAWRGETAGVLGDVAGRLEGYRSAARLFRECGDVRRAARAEANLADAFNRVGAYEEAETSLRSALAGCRRVGVRVMEGYALANLGYSLVMLERPEEALPVLEEASQVASETHNSRLAATVQVYQSRALLCAGEALRALDRAREAAQAGGHQAHGVRASAFAVASRAALAAGDAAVALELSTRAVALRDEIGSVEEDEAEIFLAHVKSLAANGRPEDAARTLERGRQRVLEIAAGISDPEWRGLFLRRVAGHKDLVGG